MGNLQVLSCILLIALSISSSTYSAKLTQVKVTNDIEASYTTLNENAKPNEAPQFTFTAKQGTKKYPGIITITGSTIHGNKTLRNDSISTVFQTVLSFQEGDDFTTTIRVNNVTHDDNTLITIKTTLRVKRSRKDGGYVYEEHVSGKIETKSAQESTDNCQRNGAFCEFDDECCGGGKCLNRKCSLSVRCITFGGQCSSPRDCCDKGALCSNGQCSPPCKSFGGQCSSARDCCDKGAICSNAKCSPPPPPCKSFGGQCSSARDCCDKGGICSNGKCSPPPPPCISFGGQCSLARDCCDKGGICSNGKCSPPPPPCMAFGGQCSLARDCCAKDGLCANGRCTPPPPPCKSIGGQCSSARDCCDKDAVCSNGQCSPPPPPCKEVLGDTCSIPDDCCGTRDCDNGKCTDESHKPGNAFAIRWSVKDEQSRNDFAQETDSNGEIVQGKYRTLMADGRYQVVTYTADWKNGYLAKYYYE